jgi:hypothetical protein
MIIKVLDVLGLLFLIIKRINECFVMQVEVALKHSLVHATVSIGEYSIAVHL